MILEIAEVQVQAGTGPQFEAAIKESLEKYISSIDGFISGEVQRGIEDPERFILLIQWETVEAHTVNFRESESYKKHRELVGSFFAKPPFVQHFEQVD